VIDAPTGDDVAPILNFDIETYAGLIDGLKLVGGTFFRVSPPPFNLAWLFSSEY